MLEQCLHSQRDYLVPWGTYMHLRAVPGAAVSGICMWQRHPYAVLRAIRVKQKSGLPVMLQYCFAALPCVVGEWSHWSGCAEQCQPHLRIRRRYVQQEPRNGGEPCPVLEEKAGCLEYLTYQGEDCGHEHGILLWFHLYIRTFINLLIIESQYGFGWNGP